MAVPQAFQPHGRTGYPPVAASASSLTSSLIGLYSTAGQNHVQARRAHSRSPQVHGKFMSSVQSQFRVRTIAPSTLISVLQEPPKPEPPQKDHAEYYGKGFRGKTTKSKRKAASKEPPAAKTLAEKKQVLIEEVSESSDSESSEVDIEVKVEDFDTPDSLNNKGSTDRSDGSRPCEPQPVKLLPPPRPGMQPVDVRSSRWSCSTTKRAA